MKHAAATGRFITPIETTWHELFSCKQGGNQMISLEQNIGQGNGLDGRVNKSYCSNQVQ